MSDGERYIYIIGGEGAHFKKVERYDYNSKSVVTLHHEAPLTKSNSQLTTCYFNVCGRSNGIIYVLTSGTLFALKT